MGISLGGGSISLENVVCEVGRCVRKKGKEERKGGNEVAVKVNRKGEIARVYIYLKQSHP